MKKVSIIFPVYNVEKYISKAIESVQKQTYVEFELLIIIDGSPDNSKKIALEYSQNDNRIMVLEKKNGGLSDARNYGLEHATGDYIYFMDSDDWIEPKLLEDNIRMIEECNLDFIVFGYYQDNLNNLDEMLDFTEVTPQLGELIKGDKNLFLDSNTLGLLGYAWNKIYRRDFIEKNNFRFEKGVSLVEDILFNTQLYVEADRIVFNKKPYYHYINREVVTLMKTFHSNSFELKKEKNKALYHFLNAWNFNEIDKTLANSLVAGFRYCVHNLFKYKNQLSFWEKIDFIKHMLNDKDITYLIDYYAAETTKDRIYAFLVKNKLALIIASLSVWKS